MRLALEWTIELPLIDGKVAVDELPVGPGIYIFARRYGKSFGALKNRVTY
jgi:hypothetical protein